MEQEKEKAVLNKIETLKKVAEVLPSIFEAGYSNTISHGEVRIQGNYTSEVASKLLQQSCQLIVDENGYINGTLEVFAGDDIKPIKVSIVLT
jgi:hypothetical protein